MIARLRVALLLTALAGCDRGKDESSPASSDESSSGGAEPSLCTVVYECLAADCLTEFQSAESACEPTCEPGPIPCSPDEEQEMRCSDRRQQYDECSSPCFEPHLTGDEFADWDEGAPLYEARVTFETCASASTLECEQARAACEQVRPWCRCDYDADGVADTYAPESEDGTCGDTPAGACL